MTIRNRELSQFGSFIFIKDSNQSVGITTEETPFVGIGTADAQYKLHIVGDTFVDGNIIITGDISGNIQDLTVGVITATSFFNALGEQLVGFDSWTQDFPDIYKVDGNVGIGTNNPTSKLQVVGNANISGDVTASSFVGNGSGLTGITAGPSVSDDTSTNQTFYPLLTQTTTGTVTSTIVSTSKLSFNPSTGTLTVIDLNSTSDIKLKENIQTVENALETVNALRGVSFDWKETGKGSYGVIAQELEEVLPELVKDGEIKSVNYNGLIGVLIEAVKDLKKEIEELKSTK